MCIHLHDAHMQSVKHAACTLHTALHRWISKEITLYLSATYLSEFFNQRNGLWTRQIPPGHVSWLLPGTPSWIRPVIPTFRFPLIWSWHRGDGLLCISPSQDGGLFTWSPPDWIWSVALLLCHPLQLRLKKCRFLFFLLFFSEGICCIITDEILFTCV